MNIYDLSHKLNNESPVYPGTSQPEFLPLATMPKEGYRETNFRFHSHLGTHIDAPAHMLEAGKPLDQMPVSNFCGEALIIEVGKNIQKIGKPELSVFENEISKADFVLFKTGWSRFWGSGEYFMNFPVLTEEATRWLVSFPLKGIGFDAISADPVEETGFKNHYIIFEAGLIIIENLVFPEELTEKTGSFYCFRLPYENADGSPVRAVLITL